MPCTSPIEVSDPQGFRSRVACGRCRSCRIRRKQAWVGRLRLERQCHQYARFITLTYRDDPGVLNPKDISDFMKRYRHHYGACRFFAVGEYGDQFGRGHWHSIIFGHAPEAIGHWRCKAWDFGYAFDGGGDLKALGYVASYVMKHVNDLHKPICRMSNRPGIGFKRIGDMARAAVRHGGVKSWPLGYRVEEKFYPLCQGGLEHFKKIYLESGGLAPSIHSPVARDLVAVATMKTGVSALQSESFVLEQERMRNAFALAPSRQKSSS